MIKKWITTEIFLIDRLDSFSVIDSIPSPGENTIEIITNSPEETFNLGKKISGHLTNGSVITLDGNLGSGKTCFVKGIAFGLGITENITSPTYTIINEYYMKNSSNSFYHIDVYRLNNEEDFESTGGSQILNGNGIVLIEWGHRINRLLPPGTISISFTITGNTSRLIKIKGLPL